MRRRSPILSQNAISKGRITTTSTRISAGTISRIITSPSILPNSILTRLRRSSLRPSARSSRPQRSKPLHIQFEFTLPFIFFIFCPFCINSSQTKLAKSRPFFVNLMSSKSTSSKSSSTNFCNSFLNK